MKGGALGVDIQELADVVNTTFGGSGGVAKKMLETYGQGTPGVKLGVLRLISDMNATAAAYKAKQLGILAGVHNMEELVEEALAIIKSRPEALEALAGHVDFELDVVDQGRNE
jgi:hypothetical protein